MSTTNAARYIQRGDDLAHVSTELIKDWLDEIRDRISVTAEQLSASRKDFAATLVGAIIGETRACFFHVGDGAATFRVPSQQEWIVPSWPAQGQFAATTYFITDDPEPQCRVTAVDERVEQLAVFTDGLERLVLDFSNVSAFSPFFERMIKPLEAKQPGRHRPLSRQLDTFLDSSAVCEKTDDDKTLVLARRSSEK